MEKPHLCENSMRGISGSVWHGTEQKTLAIIFSAVAANKQLNRLEGNWIGSRGVWYKVI